MKYLIKICGITSEKDLIAAWKLGANFVGFVLVEKSKRFIDLKKLESLSMMVSKPLKSVALLVDPSDDFLEKLLLSISYLLKPAKTPNAVYLAPNLKTAQHLQFQ